MLAQCAARLSEKGICASESSWSSVLPQPKGDSWEKTLTHTPPAHLKLRGGISHESNSDKEPLSQRWTQMFAVFSKVISTTDVWPIWVCLFDSKVPNYWMFSGWQIDPSTIVHAHGVFVNLSSYLGGVHDGEYNPFYFVIFTGEIKCKTGCATAVQKSPCDFILHCLRLLLFLVFVFVPFTCFFSLHIWTSRLLKIYLAHLPLFFQLKHIYFAVHLKLLPYISYEAVSHMQIWKNLTCC